MSGFASGMIAGRVADISKTLVLPISTMHFNVSSNGFQSLQGRD